MMLVLLYKGFSLTSRLIRWRTWSIYSHAAIVPSDNWRSARRMADYLTGCPLYESWQHGGVALRVGIHTAHTPGTLIDVFEIADPFIDASLVRRFLSRQLGAAYDWSGVLGFISRRDGAHAFDRWFCSELVFAACRSGGLDLLARIEPHRVAPGLLALSPHLMHLGSIRTGTLDWEPAQPGKPAERRSTASQEPPVPTHPPTPTLARNMPLQLLHCHIRPQPPFFVSARGALTDFALVNPLKEHFA
jgi:hypothetical protein